MGLFGLFGKKEEIMPMVSDIFSPEDIEKIVDVIGPKARMGDYGKFSETAKAILQILDEPEKGFSKRDWNGIIFAAGALTKLEPDLAPMLNNIIDKFHAFGK